MLGLARFALLVLGVAGAMLISHSSARRSAFLVFGLPDEWQLQVATIVENSA